MISRTGEGLFLFSLHGLFFLLVEEDLEVPACVSFISRLARVFTIVNFVKSQRKEKEEERNAMARKGKVNELGIWKR